MVEETFVQLNQLLGDQPIWLKGLVGVFLLLLVLFILYLLLSLIFFPMMYLFNRFTDRNKSNPLSREELLIGELTEKIQGESIGEVMAIGDSSARSSYPARLYREAEQKAGVQLAKGSRVLIVGFDDQGIALVVERNSI